MTSTVTFQLQTKCQEGAHSAEIREQSVQVMETLCAITKAMIKHMTSCWGAKGEWGALFFPAFTKDKKKTSKVRQLPPLKSLEFCSYLIGLSIGQAATTRQEHRVPDPWANWIRKCLNAADQGGQE